MLRPTLVVGIGTSGMEIVSEVQKLMYESFGVNSLPIFRYVYLETDTGKSHEETPAGSDIVPLHLTVQGLRQAYEVLNNNPQLSLDWISKNLPSQLTYNAQGAGGVRPAGRLLLWGDGNFTKVYDALQSAWQQVVNPDSSRALRDRYPELVQRAGGFDNRAVVYVVGTLVGGTCSGTFIDVGYMLRHITGMAESGSLYGIFLLPREGLNLSMGYGNCHGALTELEFFRDPQNFYQEVWPNNVRIPVQQLPPYAIVYLVTPEYGLPQFAGMGLSGCYKVVALRLFCDLVGLSSLRGSVLADGMNEGYGFYATFGIAAVMYPKYALMESAGCAQARALCDRWLMPQAYITATGDSVSINEKEVSDEANTFMAEKLMRAFAILSAKGAQPGGLRLDIEDDIDRIIRKEEARPSAYLAGRFTAGRPGNYYAAVIDNLDAAQDQLIQDIRDFIYEKARATENFEYLELLLKQIHQWLQETLAYWDRCRIPESFNEWNDYVSGHVQRLFERKHVWLGQRRNVLQDRAENLLARLKMFAMRKVLKQLLSSLERGNLTTVDQTVALPTLEHLSAFRENVQRTRESLQQREAAIAAEVSDVSVPIFRVWNSGSFQADLNNLQQSYNARHGPSTVADVTQERAWDLFSKSSSRALFERIKVGYQGRFRELLPPVNVIQVANQQADQTREYAQRALAGLLRLTLRAHSGDHGVPRFVLGAETGALNALASRLSQQGLQDFQPGAGGHVRRLGLFDHAVVFYEEKARVNPAEMLSVAGTLKYWFESPGVDASGAKIHDEDTWKQHRLAYNVEKRRRVVRVQGLMDFVLDFVLIWEPRPGGVWKPVASRWKDFPVTVEVPPRFHFRDASGTERDFELDPDPRKVRDLADTPTYYNVLRDKVVEIVRTLGEQELNRLYEHEVRQYLEARDRETSRAKKEYYFGKAGERDGLIHQLRSGQY